MPAATTKQDEANATVVFDLAKVSSEDREKASLKPSARSDEQRRQEGREGPLHLGSDVRCRGQALHRHRRAGGGLSRGPGKACAAAGEFFKSDEQHIRCLAWDAKGNLIAGSDGSGLVYRISPQGKGYVLFDAPRREITSVAVGANGTIYAASVGDKSHNPLPPLPVQGTGIVTFTVVQPGSLQVANQSASAAGRNRDLRARGRAGAAQDLVGKGRGGVRAGGAARRPAGAQRQSRARIPHPGRRHLLPMWRTWKRSRV